MHTQTQVEYYLGCCHTTPVYCFASKKGCEYILAAPCAFIQRGVELGGICTGLICHHHTTTVKCQGRFPFRRNILQTVIGLSLSTKVLCLQRPLFIERLIGMEVALHVVSIVQIVFEKSHRLTSPLYVSACSFTLQHECI